VLGDAFTVADAYLFTVLRWTDFAKMDRGKWPALAAYFELVGRRPKVQEALKAEGLTK
jgi:glutathione S-transferase